jgi:SAM-dependent methyltransferase
MPAAIADIGCSQLSFPVDDKVVAFARRFGKSVPDGFGRHCFMGDLYRGLGFDYVSLDLADAPYVHRFDLNCDQVPDDLRGRFDLIVNAGTTEHVLNQLNALKAIHDLAKPSGLIYSMFLINGYGPHGLLRYCERFVDLLAQANHYTVLYRRTYEVASSNLIGDWWDRCEWVVFKKTSDSAFNVVLDL